MMDEELIDDCGGRENAIISLEARVAMDEARWENFQPVETSRSLCVVEVALRLNVPSSKKVVGIWEFRSILSPIRTDSMSERSLRYPNITCSTHFHDSS